MNRAHKSCGNGTTHKIREQLNFKDNKKWKQFSSRRLELIDKFGLSERKASEQDENIRQLATILRTEFRYPASTAGEFEKLVTAAVQSVRRNRKRCTKNRTGGLLKRSGTTTSSCAGSSGSENEDNSISQVHSPVNPPGPPSTPAPSAGAFFQTSHPTKLPVLQPEPVRVVVNRQLKSELSTAPSSSGNITNKLVNYDALVKDVISDLVHNPIPPNQQSRTDDSTNLADLAMFSQQNTLISLALASSSKNAPEQSNSSQKHLLPPPRQTLPPPTRPELSQPQDIIPFFLREKILGHIQRSKTCLELTNSQQPFANYTNLRMLGDSCIKAAVSFIMERFFFNLLVSSTEYITAKMTSNDELAHICTMLIGPATKSKLKGLYVESKVILIQILVGSIVKDFGFEPCLYPLGEIFHDVILRQYPLVCSSSPSCAKSAILNTVSMKPDVANKEMNRKVVLKFQSREQRFTFPLLSNGPPTIAEVLENSRQLFQVPATSRNLALFNQDRIITSDADLAIILNQFTNAETVIEIKEVSYNKTVNANPKEDNNFNGLTILSSVSTNAVRSISGPTPSLTPASSSASPSSTSLSNNYTHNNMASVAALDNIISRINSPVAVKKQSSCGEIKMPPIIRARSPQPSGGQVKNCFEKGLPQPVFQPLL
ncbi:HCL162Wp [Eremothecium sinecaudum]|uniref:HCL162Wp n=1 Tax=Eremothecium sinecaudum TaxID=45286 RepID=A0A0X8HRA1_9SACH|nr:HCL162Wp [Eremothecium sinecaudum]AMD19989.1 HCL162Wp [Eremothecium sinecaudum]